MTKVAWKTEPDEHDYPAAASYLSLLAPAVPVDDPHVASDLRKIREGSALSPVLLVRGDLVDDVALRIADGYHGVCAGYYIDENTNIPCRMVARTPRAIHRQIKSGRDLRPRWRVHLGSLGRLRSSVAVL